MEPNDEESLLRSVALQNAKSISLARDRAEDALRKQTEWLRITLGSIGDAVISTDAEGRVTFLNRVAEFLTGWPMVEAVGRPLPDIFQIVNETSGLPVENPALQALRQGIVVGLANHTILIARDGTRRPIDDSAAPMRDEEGTTHGAVLVFRDVTERKRAEEIRERIAAIVDSSDDAIISKNLEGVIQSWNAGAERLFGYSAAEAVGQSISLIIPPERSDEERTILKRMRRGERINHFETIRVAKNGRRIDLSLSVSPLRDNEGNIFGASKIARDITERKRAEDERERLLREVQLGRERLAEVFHRAPSFLAIFRGQNHVFELANERYYQLIGNREIIGKPVREAVPEAEGQDFFERLDDVFRTGKSFTSGEMRTMLRREPDRPLEERYVEFVLQTLKDPDGSVSGILVQGIDLTERKRAETALRERDERLRLFLDNATDYALIITDVQGRILEWKGGAETITGWREAEMLGTSSDILFTAEDRAAHVPENERMLAARDGRAEEKRWHLRKDGTRFFGDGVMTSLRSAAGELHGFGKILRDFTERRWAEDALRDADRRKDEFIAILAHELRNPLAPIRNGLQVMRLAGHDPDVVAQARSMMDRQLSHMVRLIDDLLDVSRISQNKMELRRTQVLLSEIVGTAVETARPLIESMGHELHVQLPTSPVLLDADFTRIAQVLSNLLTNSAKYTEAGGRIWLTAERIGNEAVISVRDTGIGIAAESLPRVFEMFSQVDRTMERSSGGLGIGLALVKGLVEMHGGTAKAESGGEGMGSTFTVRLPALETNHRQIQFAPSPSDSPAVRPKRSILVVDDNRDSARTLTTILTLLGNEVHTAHDGVEAVEAADQFRPQAILMDVGMPRMNGYEAARRIREQPWGRFMVIIALTGWGQEGDRARSMEAGCEGHLVKPVDLLELERLLDELMAQRTARVDPDASHADAAVARS